MIITAESGQDVTLTCRAPNNNNIIVVEWIRADLGDEYVYMYRDERSVLEDQHPSFKNRVDLQDRQMKDGDVSLILKNVMINNAGTYECGVILIGTKHLNITSITNLTVAPPGQTGGHTEDGLYDTTHIRWIFLLLLPLFLPLLDVFVLISIKYQKSITAESGQDVTLTCRAPNNNITAVKWSRADLGNKYVFLSKGAWVVPDNQHPSFKNRVDLQDREMKDGDVSLTLKDVTINDTGTYKCGVYKEETDSWKLIRIISLRVVVPPEPKTITAESGQDVTLTRRAPNSESEKMSFISLSVDPES